MTSYPLPNHPCLTSLDPLGICSLDGESISHVKLLRELISKANKDFAHLEASNESDAWTRCLEALLQDIAYSLHSQSDLDATGLQKARLGSSTRDRCAFRTNLFDSALQLETLFPGGNLFQLSGEHGFTVFSPVEMDCLLAHMFLGTLQIPTGNTWGRPGFTQYYDGKIVPVVANTAIPYLETIIQHFIDGGYAANMHAAQQFDFYYSSATSMPDLASCERLVPHISVTLVDKPTDPSTKRDAFVLVAANAEPGPGAGGTHEERLVGQSPALAIASILTPKLGEDAAVVTSQFPVHATWEGHGREAKMLTILPPNERPTRQYIIADALPLDLSHRQSDILENNINREVRKLYAAFSGARRAWESQIRSSGELKIEMPPWGCGAFGGSLKVKMPCMAMAADLAGWNSEDLELLVPRDRANNLWEPPKEEVTLGALYSQMVGRDRPTPSPLGYLKNLISRPK